MKNNKNKKSLFQLDISFGGPSLTQKVLFAKNLAIMLKSGMTLVEALHTVRDSVSGKFRSILSKVIKKVESGVPLSDSLSKYKKVFPEVFINVAQAGESSGTLPENLENIANQLKKDKDLITKIKGAMVYPVIILIATFFLGIAVSFFILPKIIPLFESLEVDLPFSTRMLVSFSNLVESHGIILFGSIILFLLGLFWLLRKPFLRPATHWLIIKLPIIGRISRNANLARFSSTLGSLLKSGITIDEGLEITRRSVGNHYYKKELFRISKKIKAGSRLSNELTQNDFLFPAMTAKMVKVGEESGRFEESFAHLAEFYEGEVDTAIKNFTTMLEPLLLLFIGSIVGFLALSIISPIYDITGNIQK